MNMLQYSIEAKATHGMHGLVPIILAEDKTKVKARLMWESHDDILVRFCRLKDGHNCIADFKLHVGDNCVGYENILNGPWMQRIGGSFRAIIVNPLHDKLPSTFTIT
jgi:hypothetical protein